ncbi:hypothetical protein M422DRAFT_782479 [Sphaerobolus stellatus SS14]|uniref:Uncharacterized protein n=1 Tax=Sphaerobolus stellatus (strain SS14) TaxID=990650 RepID=A0A0C9VDF7_SPHS4|nr:hypothetical protein M422DRAFT_782479 [Sphaerobolus stellatus SS14]
MGFGNPLTDPAVPDIIVQPELGIIYTTSHKKIAEHGGLSVDDRHIACFASNPGLKKTTFGTKVQTTQIAPVILKMLGLDPNSLQGRHNPCFRRIFAVWGLESAITGRLAGLNVSGVDVSVPDAISIIMVCRFYREIRLAREALDSVIGESESVLSSMEFKPYDSHSEDLENIPSLTLGDVEQGLRRPDAVMDAGHRMPGITLVEGCDEERGIMTSNIPASQPVFSQDEAHPRHYTQKYTLETRSSSNLSHTTRNYPAALDSIHREPQREAYYPRRPVELAAKSTMIPLHKMQTSDGMFLDGTVPIPVGNFHQETW